MFRQFAVTLVIAVLLSGLVALTLTPALCAMLLKGCNEDNTSGFFGLFNRKFHSLTDRYVGIVGRVLGRPRIWFTVFLLMVAAAFWLWKRVPTAFIPTEDKGYFAIAMQLPDAASLQRTKAVIGQIEGFLHEEPSVVNVVAFAGLDVLTRTNQTNSATIFILLKPWDERGKNESIDAITKRINGKLFGMKDAVGFAFNLPEIPGLGSTAGVEVNLQNRSGKDVRDFAQNVQAFQAAVNQLPAVQAMTTTFRANVPQVYLDVDRASAKSRGVSLTDLFSTLQTFLSTLYINDFNLYGSGKVRKTSPGSTSGDGTMR
jgi:multidrug efflux pump